MGGFFSGDRLTTSCMRSLLLGILLMLTLLAAPVALAERVAFHDIFKNNKKLESELSGVNHIVQDKQGFMWFGSEKGLARYDGTDVRIYRHDSNDPYSIPNDIVHGLLIDQAGVMWVATETESGLCYYDSILDRFVRENNKPELEWPSGEVNALALDRKNTLYVGTVLGLYRLAADRRRLELIPLRAPPGADVAKVSAIVVDVHDIVWVGTAANGLISYDPRTGEQRHYVADSTSANSLTHNTVAALEVDGDDRLWIGTLGRGLSILSADRKSFENHVYKENEPSTLVSNVIWDIFADGLGNVWLAIDNQGGLVRFNKDDGFTSQRNKPYDPTSIGANQVRTIYEDRKGDLWVGLFPSGVNFHNLSTRHVQIYRHEPNNRASLSHSAILDIHKDPNGDIWIGTEDGLNQFDPVTGKFNRYSKGLSAKAVLSVAQFDDKTLWVGTWSGGLYAFDLTTRKFTPVNTRPVNGESQNSMFIWDILRDRNGNMWIATEFEGAGFYDRELGQFRFYSLSFAGAGSLPDNYVRDVMEDSNGAIWFGTNSGLAILKPGQKKPVWILRDLSDPHGLHGERIFALHEDRRGRVWVGTEDKDAFVYDPVTTHFQRMGSEQGLPPGLIGGFIEDLQGYIWILTTNGLVKVDSDTFGLQVFGPEHGLTGNTFNRNAAMRNGTGRLFIGGAEGLNSFDPVNLGQESSDFPVVISKLRVMNREVKVGGENSPLKQAIGVAQTIELDHQDLMFAFDFAALDYRHSKDMRYAYLLQGFDAGWNYVGNSRSATYTNISPGHYRFRVKASYGKSDWTESRDLQIVIRPAPWKTWWAFLIYAALFFTTGYFCAHYFRLRGHTQVYKTLLATDVLTGVANRVGITQAAEGLFSQRQEQCLAVIFMDIDHFKKINDTRGHDSGDRVLVEVAGVFQQCLRQSDLVGRWGGEEFVLVWVGEDRAAAILVAEKIRQSVADHVFDQNHAPLKVTASLGMAFAEPGESFESAVKRSDHALYEAKRSGRNCVVVAQ